MRELGRHLGVDAMSLYNHVDNKDDLLNGIVDLVVGEIDLPPGRHAETQPPVPEGSAPRSHLRRQALSA